MSDEDTASEVPAPKKSKPKAAKPKADPKSWESVRKAQQAAAKKAHAAKSAKPVRAAGTLHPRHNKGPAPRPPRG